MDFSQFFGELIHIWLPRSSNFLDYFLWKYLKNRVHEEIPATLEVLKQKIKAKICKTDMQILRHVLQNLLKQASAYINSLGSHFDPL